MVSRRYGLLNLLAFVSKRIVSCGALAVLVGCSGNTGQPEPPKVSAIAGQVANAQEQVQTFEAKRAKAQAILDKTLTDQDELVAKLRKAGVNKPADLKGNLRGQELAKSVQEIGVEIEVLERQIRKLDNAILQAKALVRRSEREQAGISDEEWRKLSEQMKESAEVMDGAASPVTPLDVESALEKLLSSQSSPSKSVSPNSEAKSGSNKDAQTKLVQPITLEELDRNPAKYKGQTIQVACQLSGTTFPSDEQRLRLNVKGETVSVTASSIHPNGINFILPKSRQSLLDGFTKTFSAAKLTVTVNQGVRGYWLATVSSIEKGAP